MARFDRILAGRAVNKQAAVVTGAGIQWTSNYRGNPHARKWDAPPTCAPLPTDAATLRTFVDLTGRRIGRVTVIGYLGKPNAKKKGVWLVRCTCGTYESRGAKALKNTDRDSDMCEDCGYLERVKRGDSDLRPKTQ